MGKISGLNLPNFFCLHCSWWVYVRVCTWYGSTHPHRHSAHPLSVCCSSVLHNHIVRLVHKKHIIRTCLMYVPRSLQSWVSTIHKVVLTADVFQLFFWVSTIHKVVLTADVFQLFFWKTLAVSTTLWMVETQLCKLRGTSDFFYKKLKNFL